MIEILKICTEIKYKLEEKGFIEWPIDVDSLVEEYSCSVDFKKEYLERKDIIERAIDILVIGLTHKMMSKFVHTNEVFGPSSCVFCQFFVVSSFTDDKVVFTVHVLTDKN